MYSNEDIMDTHPQIDPASTARLLICMSLAIDEIKQINCIKNSSAMIRQLEVENPSSHRLLFLKREILNLETRLAKTRSRASRTKIVTKLPKLK
ncbi:hypothetical protein N8198_00720 [Gammaproteobacteria bacterium]|nr:hypothetical protein [Gammaproteobacteria bacterium]